MRALLVAISVIAVTSSARADTFDLTATSARSLGRAGAGVVSSDDGAALLVNPAGLARRVSWRVQLGLAVVDRESSHATDVVWPDETALPTEDRAGASLLPAIAAQGGLGDRVTIGVALLAPTDAGADWSAPTSTLSPSSDGSYADDGHLAPHRYGGTSLRLTRRGVAVGAGVRALPWLALGVSVMVFDVELAQERTIWSGPPVAPGATIADLSPAWDQTLSISARGFAPAASFGLIVAPEDVPVELGASVTWSGDADLDGDVALSDSRGVAGNGMPLVRGAVADDASASLTLRSPTTFRAGARFLTSRAAFEANVEYWLLASTPVWTLDGVELDVNGVRTPLGDVPLGPSFRDGFALRGAVDVDVVRGFLAVTAGYAYAGPTTLRSRTSPVWPSGASHTVSLGVEARVAGALVTLGAARTERTSTTLASSDAAVLAITPRAPSAIPAAGGTWDAAATVVALGVELEWP